MIANWLEVSDLSDPSSPYAEELIKTASFVIYNLTGQRWAGVREVTEFYVEPEYEDNLTAYKEFMRRLGSTNPRIVESKRDIPLYGRPARKIIEVRENNTILNPSEYTLINKSRLRRNNCEWTFCGGVEVTYQYGVNPPIAGKIAAMTLADELMAYFNGNESCRIPQGAINVSRQGTDITMIDMNDYIKDGRTGLPSVDLFIQAANPTRALKKAKVFSPHDRRRERRVTQ